MNLLKKFLSRKKRVTSKPATETVEVRPFSQQTTVALHMHRANIKHDETVEANLKGVRIGRTNQNGNLTDVGILTMFFCPLEEIQVVKRLTPGDNDHIPGAVRLNGFNVESDFLAGVYNLNNVMLHANGLVNITATAKTTFELIRG